MMDIPIAKLIKAFIKTLCRSKPLKEKEFNSLVLRRDKFFMNEPLVLYDKELNIYHYATFSSTVEGFRRKLLNGHYRLETFSCPICEGQKFTEIINSGEGFCFSICRTCGLTQNNKRMRTKDMEEFYKTGEYHEICMGGIDEITLHNIEYHVMSMYILDCFRKAGLSIQGLKIVDIGCGSGGVLRAFKENGAEVKGFDINPKLINFGKQFLDTIYVRDILLQDIDLSDMDIVLLSNVLEHLPEPKLFLRKLSQRIGNRTRLIIDVPNLNTAAAYGDFSIHDFQTRPLSDFFHIGHIWYFDPITINNLLTIAGLRIEFIFPRNAGMLIFARKSTSLNTQITNAYLLSSSSINYVNFKRYDEMFFKLIKWKKVKR